MSEDTDRATLGARLREAREYQGFSQEDVAKYLGVPRSAISLIETGARGLDILELKKLATLYDCSLEDLTGAQPGQPAEPDSIKMVARAAAALSAEDRSEVLRFAQFLQTRKSEKKSGKQE
ncbi:MAG TPA: helix-turn-helix transcriptional regulator [Polyangia bacterium]|nr:helix-turn-helix transcriptional regulator [Polyangia bacterium]